MNKSMPAYAHIFVDMVRVLPKDTEYRRTDKGTVIRAAFYRDFADQIEKAYVDESSGSLVLSKSELMKFLRKDLAGRIASTTQGKLEADDDLFSLGIDSLQAIQVRNTIIKNIKMDASKLGRNFVFDFPTLNKMADEILRLQSGEPERKVVGVEERMSALIEKYAVFPQHVPQDNATAGKFIVSKVFFTANFPATMTDQFRWSRVLPGH